MKTKHKKNSITKNAAKKKVASFSVVNNTKKSVAIFMILLIITLPVFSSVAVASGVSSANVHGQDNIDGFFRQEDDTNYDIVASFDDDTPVVLSNIYINNNYPLSDICTTTTPGCVLEADGYRCGCADSWSVGVTPLSLSISLKDNNNQQVGGSIPKTLIADTLSPVPGLSTPTTNQNQLTLQYSITDTACTGNTACSGKCSGIKKIEFYDNGYLADTVMINGEPNGNDCTKTGSWTKTLTEGEHLVTAVAYDNTNNAGATEEPEEIFIDTTSPTIGASYQLLSNGNPVEYVSTIGPNSYLENVVVVATVNEANELGSVWADLSSLNYYGNLGHVTGQIVDNSVSPKTVLFNIGRADIDADQSSTSVSPQIIIHATDAAGLISEGTATTTIPVDNSGPGVTYFGPSPQFCVNEVCYVKANSNRLQLRLSESGAGMDNVFAFVNLNSLGYSGAQRMASCTLDGGEWLCQGYATVASNLDGQTASISVSSMTTDDAGNVATGTMVWQVVVDTTPPRIYLNDISVVDNSGQSDSVLFDNGGALITAKITESGSGIEPTKVFANMADIAVGATWKSADSCVQDNEENYTCSWTYTLAMTPAINTIIHLNVSDNAGNEVLMQSPAFSIIGHVVGAERNCWNDVVEVESLAELNPNYLWKSQGTYQDAVISLTRAGQGCHIYGFTVSQCYATVYDKNFVPNIASQSQYIENRYTKRAIFSLYGGDSADMRAALQSATTTEDDRLDQINITCNIDILQANSENGPVLEPHEQAQLKVDIPLMENSIFTEPSLRALDDILEMERSIKRIDAILKIIDPIVDRLQKTCKVMTAVRQLLSTIVTIVCTIDWWSGGTFCKTSDKAMTWLNKLWYGSTWDVFYMKLSPYGPNSIGFWCQLVMCNECVGLFDSSFNAATTGTVGVFDGSGNWLDQTSGSMASLSPDSTSEYYREINSLDRGGDNQIGMGDIQNNIILSLSCVPPCLVGVKTSLERLKDIYIWTNVCNRRAEIEGFDKSTCDEFKAAMTCQWITGQLWQATIGRLMQAVVHTLVKKLVDRTIFEIARKCSNNPKPDYLSLSCAIAIGLDIWGIHLEIQKAEESWQTISDAFGGNDDDESEAAANDAIDDATDDNEDSDDDHLGGGPG